MTENSKTYDVLSQLNEINKMFDGREKELFLQIETLETQLKQARNVAADFETQTQAHLQQLIEREHTLSEHLAQVQREATQSAEEQSHAHAEREQRMKSELAALREELATVTVEASERERIAQQQLEALRHEMSDKAAQASEQHEFRERELLDRIETLHTDIRQLEQERSERERALTSLMSRVREDAHRRAEEYLRQLAEQEKLLRQEFAAREYVLHEELDSMSHTLAQREQEFGEKQLQSRQTAEQEKAELFRTHAEGMQALQHEFALREDALRKEHSAFLTTLATREKEFGGQLLAAQKAAEKDKAELTRFNAEREKILRQGFTARENGLREELDSMLRIQTQREQDFAQQLLKLHQEADQARRQHEQSLRDELAGREAILTKQLHAGQQELRRIEQEWAKNEKGMDKEIAGLRSEIQLIQHAQKLQAQQHGFELTTRDAEHNRLIQAGTELEARLNDQIQAEQRTSLQLRQALVEFQQTLAMTHASLSWRMTAPLRKLAALFSPSNDYGSSSTMAEQAGTSPAEASSPPGIMPKVAESQPVTIQQTPMELIMPSTATTVASTLNELLSLHDQTFIQCAYLTLLGREADPEGFQYYLGRLRQGSSKIQILVQLRSSAEGKAHASTLPGLDTAIRRYQWAQNPLVGWLVRLFYVVDKNTGAAHKLRRIENQLLLLSDESNRRFNQMETALAGLHHLVEQQTQTIVAAVGSTRLDTPDVSANSPIQQPEPDGLNHLSSRAKEIYFQLKSAAAIHAGRVA